MLIKSKLLISNEKLLCSLIRKISYYLVCIETKQGIIEGGCYDEKIC